MSTSAGLTKPRIARYLLALVALLTGLAGATAGVLAQGLPGAGGGLFAEPKFLPVDEAFSFYTSLPDQGSVMVHWNIAQGYYLYREKFAFALGATVESVQPVMADLPEGVAHHDEFFGDVEVYYDEVAARMQIPTQRASRPQVLVIEYQGCSEMGLCYPPQRRVIEL